MAQLRLGNKKIFSGGYHFNYFVALVTSLSVFFLVNLFSPAFAQEAIISDIILDRTSVAAGCPLVIDVLLRECKDNNAQTSLIMAISSQCDWRSWAAAANGGMGPGAAVSAPWSPSNFEDVIVSRPNGGANQIGVRYKSGVAYWYAPYSCNGPTQSFGGILLDGRPSSEVCQDWLMSTWTSGGVPVGRIQMWRGLHLVRVHGLHSWAWGRTSGTPAAR